MQIMFKSQANDTLNLAYLKIAINSFRYQVSQLEELDQTNTSQMKAHEIVTNHFDTFAEFVITCERPRIFSEDRAIINKLLSKPLPRLIHDIKGNLARFIIVSRNLESGEWTESRAAKALVDRWKVFTT